MKGKKIGTEVVKKSERPGKMCHLLQNATNIQRIFSSDSPLIGLKVLLQRFLKLGLHFP